MSSECATTCTLFGVMCEDAIAFDALVLVRWFSASS